MQIVKWDFTLTEVVAKTRLAVEVPLAHSAPKPATHELSATAMSLVTLKSLGAI